MKVIFLDIDGVLNSDRSIFSLPMREIKPNSYRYNYLLSKTDPIAVAILNRLVKDTNAKIVVSSANRKFFGEKIADVLKDMGVEADIIGITTTTGGNRGTEIQAWLDLHEVGSYVILDDSSDMLESQRENFVNVDPKVGLDFGDLNLARKILGADESLILLI